MTATQRLNYKRAFIALLVGTGLFRLFYIQWVELAPDEAYYFTWSRHLQWGYYDHPPMVGFLIRVFTVLAGPGEFGVRLGWVIIGALLTFLLYRMGKRMFGSEAAGFYAALLLNISLLAATGAVIVTPDGPQGLFWALGVFSVYKAVDEERPAWWYATGLWLGLGLLSKYTMILLVPCVFLFLISSPDGRKWLRRREPYLALVLGLIVFSPVIYWNGQNEWVSFRFQLAHGLEMKKAPGWKSFGDFWAGQAGVLSPFLFLAILWAMGKSAWMGFRQKQRHFLLLFWTSAPVFLFFACTSLRSRVEANWPALAYFSAAVALAGLACGRWRSWTRPVKGVAWAVGGSACILTLLAHLQALVPLIPIPAGMDPTSQLHGWKTLGETLKGAAARAEAGKPVFLLTPRHQLAGEGMFYTRGEIPVYQWDAPLRVNHLAEKLRRERGEEGRLP